MRSNSKRIIFIACGALILLGLVALVFFIINSAKSTTLSILVAPTDSTIKVNGKEYKNGNYKIFPSGKYEVTIEREGFETKELTLNSDKVVNIHEYLETSDMSKYRDSAEDYKVLRLIADYNDSKISSFIEESNKIESIKYKLPVWTSAPYENYDITSSPGIKLADGNSNLECKKMSCIMALIGGKRSSREDKAIEDKIKALGYDPKDYHIIYVENHNVKDYDAEE